MAIDRSNLHSSDSTCVGRKGGCRVFRGTNGDDNLIERFGSDSFSGMEAVLWKVKVIILYDNEVAVFYTVTTY